VRTANFTLFGDATAAKTKEVGLELERLRAVLLLLKPSPTARSPVPTSVYVFKSREAMEPYLPRRDGKPANVGAFFQESDDGNFIALSARWNSDPRRIVYHEYIHDFLRANFPPQPVWYDEGLADYFSTFRSTEEEAQTGMIREDHLQRLRNAVLLPLDRLFAVDRGSPEYNEELKQSIFYAESWALVHYLMRGNPDRTPQLGRFLVLLQQGRPRAEAFREAFHAGYDTIFSELVAYVRNKRFFYNRLKFSELKIPAEARTAPMRYEDVLYRLGDLLAHGTADRLPDSERLFEAVVAADPSHAGALAGLGRVRLRQKRYDEAAACLGRAIASGSADFRVFFYDGRLRWEALARKSRGAPAVDPELRALLEEARAAFRRSIELNPDFPEARAALGRTYLLEEGPGVDEGIAALEAARKLLPSREDVATDLAKLYDRKGERARSDAVLGESLGASAAEALSKRTQRSQLEIRIEEVNRLLEQGEDDEALARFEGLVAESRDEVRTELETQRDALKKAAARNRAVEQYNAAIALYNKRDLPAALAAFERVAAESADADVAAAAREKAAELSRLVPKKTRKP
jgi:tetratricopeptide (TPR) repeat protein